MDDNLSEPNADPGEDAPDEFTSLLGSFLGDFALLQVLGFLLLIVGPALFLIWVMSWAPGW